MDKGFPVKFCFQNMLSYANNEIHRLSVSKETVVLCRGKIQVVEHQVDGDVASFVSPGKFIHFEEHFKKLPSIRFIPS